MPFGANLLMRITGVRPTVSRMLANFAIGLSHRLEAHSTFDSWSETTVVQPCEEQNKDAGRNPGWAMPNCCSP